MRLRADIAECKTGMLEGEELERMSRILTVEDVKKLVEGARGGTADPMAILRGLFEGLGESATLTGDVLQQGLQESGIPLPAEAKTILGNVQTVEKSVDDLKLVLTSELQPEVRGVKLKLGPAISGTIQKFPDGVALVGISGVLVNQFIWIDIQRVQFKENAGKRSVKVDTNFGGKEFQLP
jgi:hypothetical protein